MIRYFISLIVVAFLACACSADNDIVETLDVDQPEGDSIIMVGINLVGDINVEEMPLTRGLESKDVIGIHIFRNGESFCFGLFNDLSNVKVALRAGSTYSVEATMIKDFDLNETKYKEPFRFYYITGSKGSPMYHYYDSDHYYSFGIINKFDYYSTYNKNFFKSSSIPESYYSTGAQQYNRKDVFCKKIDRFYGEINNYTPTVDGKIDLPLRRVSFGIKMKVIGLTDGSVNIKCWHNRSTDCIFYNNSSITSDFEGGTKIFSLYDIYDAWQYADADYQEAVKLSVIWTRGNGIVQDLGTKTAYVKRNAVNVFKIKLSTNDKDVDVDVDPEGGDMDSEDEDLSN